MSNKDLSNKPKDFKSEISTNNLYVTDSKTWFYEEPSGILIVTEITKNGISSYVQSKISWKSIRASLSRKDKK